MCTCSLAHVWTPVWQHLKLRIRLAYVDDEAGSCRHQCMDGIAWTEDNTNPAFRNVVTSSSMCDIAQHCMAKCVNMPGKVVNPKRGITVFDSMTCSQLIGKNSTIVTQVLHC